MDTNNGLVVFILCAGDATRFGGQLKQLLPINEDFTILSRQIDQLSRRGVTKFVVTHNEDIQHYVFELDTPVIIPSNRDTTCNTALSTQYRWNGFERVVFLLGDTIYSGKALNQILAPRDNVKFYGNEYEIYALGFPTDRSTEVVTALTKGADTRNGERWFGKLRYAYRELIGKHWKKGDTIDELKKNTHFYYLQCNVTRDIDTPEAYKEFIEEGVEL